MPRWESRNKQFCAEHDIPIENCGKLIVATTPIEVQRLGDLKKRGALVKSPCTRSQPVELSTLEPHVTGLAALLVPSTGIVDYRSVSRALAEDIEKQGGEVRLRSCVSSITEGGAEVEVVLSHGEVVRTGRLVACGGLQADRLAQSAGLDVRLRIIPFRGEYFQLPPDQSQIVRHLIYPVPDPSCPFSAYI